ncbi:MAG: virginiamycin B lyase family protein [Pseudohongiellaceae bacterium]
MTGLTYFLYKQRQTTATENLAMPIFRKSVLLGLLLSSLASGITAQHAALPYTDGVVYEVQLPGENLGPTTLAVAADGKLWFTLSSGNAIGRVDADGSNYVQFDLPHPGSSPRIIALGSDGNMWFSEHEGNRMGRITPDGILTEWELPTQASQPRAIALGSDGNIWIGQFAASRIARITPQGEITEFVIPTPDSGPRALAAGPDGNIWFSEFKAGKIGRITPQGQITEYELPRPNTGPGDITAGADGALWFLELGGQMDGLTKDGNRVGRITVDGVISEFAIPSEGSTPINIAVGPDHNVWYTKNATLGRVTPAGAITEFPIAEGAARAVGLTAGSDRQVPERLIDRLWFTDSVNNRIAYLQFTASPD